MIDRIPYFKKRPFLADSLSLVILCIATIIIGKLITTFLILPGFVPTGSMESTIMTGDRMLTNMTAYWNADPQRGDIVVFNVPDETARGAAVPYVKRIIGLPGETVSIQEGRVYINGILLEEPYLQVSTDMGNTYTVPENCYFMLGDNRNLSHDSRFWNIKFVPKEEIIGKVFFKYSLALDHLYAEAVTAYHDYSIDSKPN